MIPITIEVELSGLALRDVLMPAVPSRGESLVMEDVHYYVTRVTHDIEAGKCIVTVR
ncbi:hypothetical protein NBRC116587_22570 [Pseudoteredinibacter isoporae]